MVHFVVSCSCDNTQLYITSPMKRCYLFLFLVLGSCQGENKLKLSPPMSPSSVITKGIP